MMKAKEISNIKTSPMIEIKSIKRKWKMQKVGNEEQ